MGSILTFGGKHLDLENPRSSDVCSVDVSHALSYICRYGGHVPVFYSVAEHCVHAASLGAMRGCTAPQRLALLLHDAAEAYLGDVVSPLKELLPDYARLEEKWQAAVRERYGVPDDGDVRALVSGIDGELRDYEQSILRGRQLALAGLKVDDGRLASCRDLLSGRLDCWFPMEAGARFTERLQFLLQLCGRHELGGGT